MAEKEKTQKDKREEKMPGASGLWKQYVHWE